MQEHEFNDVREWQWRDDNMREVRDGQHHV